MIDRTKITDIGIIALAIIELEKHKELCPVIKDTLKQIADENRKEKRYPNLKRYKYILEFETEEEIDNPNDIIAGSFLMDNDFRGVKIKQNLEEI